MFLDVDLAKRCCIFVHNRNSDNVISSYALIDRSPGSNPGLSFFLPTIYHSILFRTKAMNDNSSSSGRGRGKVVKQ